MKPLKKKSTGNVLRKVIIIIIALEYIIALSFPKLKTTCILLICAESAQLITILNSKKNGNKFTEIKDRHPEHTMD